MQMKNDYLSNEKLKRQQSKDHLWKSSIYTKSRQLLSVISDKSRAYIDDIAELLGRKLQKNFIRNCVNRAEWIQESISWSLLYTLELSYQSYFFLDLIQPCSSNNLTIRIQVFTKKTKFCRLLVVYLNNSLLLHKFSIVLHKNLSNKEFKCKRAKTLEMELLIWLSKWMWKCRKNSRLLIINQSSKNPIFTY